MRTFTLVAVLVALAPSLHAQEPDAVYQQPEAKRFQFSIDGLLRNEWTDTENVTFQDDQRRVVRAKPRLDASFGWLTLGVGGDFTYSNDDNDETAEGTLPPIIRDNYRSKDARLDVATARLEPASWIRLQAGRFPMPVGVTEMIWDRDLRVQGAELTLQTRDRGPFRRLALTALGLRGGHVFENEDTRLDADDTEMVMLGGTVVFGQQTQLELVGAWMTWRNLGDLVPQVRRQNTRVATLVPDDYDVLDGVLRVRQDGGVPWQVVLEASVNTGKDADNKGLWAAVVLGSTVSSRGRLEYTYAKVDKDATVAAYATDDFLWATGWDGHRLDVGIKTGDRTALHGVAQLQRFKDGPEAVRDEWERRFRVDLRIR